MCVILVPSSGESVQYLSELIVLRPEAYARGGEEGKANFDVVATWLIQSGETEATPEICLLQTGYVDKKTVRSLPSPQPAGGVDEKNDLCERMLGAIAASNLEEYEQNKRLHLSVRDRTQDDKGAVIGVPGDGERIVSLLGGIKVKDISPPMGGNSAQERPFSLLSLTYTRPRVVPPRRAWCGIMRVYFKVSIRFADFVLLNCPYFSQLEIHSPAQVLHELRSGIRLRTDLKAPVAKKFQQKLEEIHSLWQGQPYDYEIAVTTDEPRKTRVSAEYHSLVRIYPVERSPRLQLIRPRDPRSGFAVQVGCVTETEYCDVMGRLAKIESLVERLIEKQKI